MTDTLRLILEVGKKRTVGAGAMDTRSLGTCSADRPRSTSVARLIASFALILVGCAPNLLPGPTQALSGTGWDLVSVGPAPFRDDVIRIQAVDDGGSLVEMQVNAAGDQGCGAPTFVGFDVVDDAIVAKIIRAPTWDDPHHACLSHSSVVIAVRLHADAIPEAVTRIAISEPCDLPGCAGESIPLPQPRQ